MNTYFDRTVSAVSRFDAAVIGGGASGMSAAVELAMRAPGLRIVLLEKNPDPGRKLRATGNGRCNITNTYAEGYEEIQSFFGRIGLMTRIRSEGLVYPYSESAADVTELLVNRLRETGVHIVTDSEVISVKGGDSFTVSFRTGGEERSLQADSVILALGGKAGPAYGTTGDGYRIARALGHTVITPVPVLTSMECREWEPGYGAENSSAGSTKAGTRALSLAGTRVGAVVTLLRRGEEIFREKGELQLTRFGLSGICIFNMTRHMRYDRRGGESLDDFIVQADLFPDGDIRDYLVKRRESAFRGEKAADVLNTVLKRELAAYVMSAAGCPENRPLSCLTDSELEAAAQQVHSLTFHPSALRGWKEAQATSGGVSLDELDPRTSESRIVPGLYITGELADRDYPCGGYNLSNAWLTGIRAAAAVAARKCK